MTEQTETLHTVQVGKADQFGIVSWGPVHIWQPEMSYRLTWCGKRMKGIRARGTRVGTVAQIKTGAVCPTCARGVATGKGKAYRR